MHGAFEVVQRFYPSKKTRIGVRLHSGRCQVGIWKGTTFTMLAEGENWDQVVGILLAAKRWRLTSRPRSWVANAQALR